MTFKQVLNKYRDISYNERDKGDRFERLMQAFDYWTSFFYPFSECYAFKKPHHAPYSFGVQ